MIINGFLWLRYWNGRLRLTFTHCSHLILRNNVGHCYMYIICIAWTETRKNVDDNFTYEVGHNLGYSKIPRYRLIKPVLLLSDKHRHIFKGFFLLFISEKKSANVCFHVKKYYNTFHMSNMINKSNTGTQNYLKKTWLLFLYNVEVRYALQLRYLSNKTRESHNWLFNIRIHWVLKHTYVFKFIIFSKLGIK